MMNPTILEITGTVLFVSAVLHTFVANQFGKWAEKYPEGSIKENLFHLLGEVEIVFGLWASVFIFIYILLNGFAVYDESHQLVGGAIHYMESLNFNEATFVFVIMCVAGTRPVILFAEKVIASIAGFLPFGEKMSFYISSLIIGPILGSFITEPAAMTVTALVLLDYFYSDKMSSLFKYATLSLLFVNISIGGTLTHFAAPPVLMVAGKWDWGISFMMSHFGYKAVISIIICTLVTAFLFKRELTGKLQIKQKHDNIMEPSWWITLVHIIFLGFIVYTVHHSVFFLGLFLLFLGFVSVTREYQDKVKLKESLLVGFFLAGLVTLGSMQSWWLKEIISQMEDMTLFFGTILLTAFTDNAALTYLGSLVELSDGAKYNLVAGAVAGGGLTVIANAPNPAGFGILKSNFENGINPLKLFLGSLPPTVVALICFQLLPS